MNAPFEHFRRLTPILLVLIFLAPALQRRADCQQASQAAGQGSATSTSEDAWRDLFDGQSLANWRETNFGGEGEVSVVEGAVRLEFGSPLTGVHWTGSHELPTLNYELYLEARRVDGSDFFCGLTFPYRDSHCSLILGGWGGGLVGLSSLDERDASENETTRYEEFVQGRWYSVRLRVRDGHVEAWLDQKKIVDCDVNHRSVSTRPEVALSRPLGVAAYETRSEIRAIRIRELSD